MSVLEYDDYVGCWTFDDVLNSYLTNCFTVTTGRVSLGHDFEGSD